MHNGRLSLVTNLNFDFFINAKTLVSKAVKKTLSTKARQRPIIIGEKKPITVPKKPNAVEKLNTSAKISAEHKTIRRIFLIFFELSPN